MPKNVLIPQDYAGLAPPVPEQSINFDQARSTVLRGYSPGVANSDAWTVSVWFKRTGRITDPIWLWGAEIDTNNRTSLQINNLGNIVFDARIGGVVQAAFLTSQQYYADGGWVHVVVQFDRTVGTLNLYVNGELWTIFGSGPTIANVAGYAFLDPAADHAFGARPGNTDNFAGLMADAHCVAGSVEPIGSFGLYNTVDEWMWKSFAGPWGAQGFHLTFGRTVDLGEDFSGNGNHFTDHVNGLSSDQYDDWPERNYCVLLALDHASLLGIFIEDGGIVMSNGNARLSIRPGPNTGVYYWEFNGAPQTWDTGVSGRVDPLIINAGTYNFGQRPFAVGPGGGQQAIISNNLPDSQVLEASQVFNAIGYAADVSDPKPIQVGTIGFITPRRNFSFPCDMVWAKRMSNATLRDWYMATRLRTGSAGPVAMLQLNTNVDELSADANGEIHELFDVAAGFNTRSGVTDFTNFNETAVTDEFTAAGWLINRYAQTQRVQDDDDDAEEFLINGDTDAGSSDLELGSEDGGAGPDEQSVGMRFLDMQIEQGATIDFAWLQFEVDTVRNDQPNDLEIWMQDADDTATFVSGSANFNITSRPKTSASVLWSPPQWTAVQDRGGPQRSTDIAAPVKEVVDRGLWVPGNSMVAIIEPESGGTVGRHEAEAHDATTPAEANEPHFSVAWSRPGGIDNGMSVFRYWGVSKANTVPHNLATGGAGPDFMAIKRLGGAGGVEDWRCYHSQIQTALPAPDEGYLVLNSDAAAVVDPQFLLNTAPNFATVVLGNSDAVNNYEAEYLGFAMREVEGFSKVFRYVGTGGSQGDFIYCGFRPRVVIIKRADGVGPWSYHSKVGRFDPSIPQVNGFWNGITSNGYLNTDGIFGNDDGILINYQGFRVFDSTLAINTLNGEYIGLAFAELQTKSCKGAI